MLPTKAAGRMIGLGRLVDVHAGENFRRILIELDGAAVVGRRLLAPVESGGREIRSEATNRDDVRAAVVPLCCKPGRRAINSPMLLSGSLPMSSAIDRFDDGLGILLLRGGAAQGGAEARDDDRLMRWNCCLRRSLRSVGGAGCAAGRRCCVRPLQGAGVVGDNAAAIASASTSPLPSASAKKFTSYNAPL